MFGTAVVPVDVVPSPATPFTQTAISHDTKTSTADAGHDRAGPLQAGQHDAALSACQGWFASVDVKVSCSVESEPRVLRGGTRHCSYWT